MPLRAFAIVTTLSLLAGGSALAETAAPAIDETVTGSIGNGAGLGDGMTGTWKGRGKVLVNLQQERPFNVKCDFDVNGDASSVSIAGECGALFVKRPVEVVLRQEGGSVSGTYDAELRTGIANLEGERNGETIALDVNWGAEVNGDTVATMEVERKGENELRIVFRDKHPETGEEVVTSEFDLERS